MKIKLKKKKNKYAQVHINLLRDKNLSLKAKGLGAILESYSNDFNLSLKSIVFNTIDGIKSVRSAIKELENGYYLYRFQTRDKKGLFITYWAFDSQKLDIDYLRSIIKELEKVELITKNELLNGVSLTAMPTTAPRLTACRESTTYNNIMHKNRKDKNTLSIFYRESFNFKNFKEYVSSIYNFKFSLSGELGYIKEHKGFCIKNGYIYSLHSQNFVEKEEAFKIWEYLYLNKDKVLNLIEEQKERIQNAS